MLESIWSVYDAVMVRRDKEMTEKIVKSLNLKISARDSRHSDPRVLLQALLAQWLPVSDAVLGMHAYIFLFPPNLKSKQTKL